MAAKKIPGKTANRTKENVALSDDAALSSPKDSKSGKGISGESNGVDDSSSVSVYDSGAEIDDNDTEVESSSEDFDSKAEESETEDSESDEDDDEDFEEQGSSDGDDSLLDKQDNDESDDEFETIENFDSAPRQWKKPIPTKRNADGKLVKAFSESTTDATDSGKDPNALIEDPKAALWMHTDDLSSDDEDEDGTGNRIGRVPLHWYDDYEHIGYDAHGTKVIKTSGVGAPTGIDKLDKAIQNQDDFENQKFVIYDALNARDVQLTDRQIELIRRVQAGAFAHPEFNANPDYIDYYSGANREISGLNSDRHELKSRFQPSKYEKMQVRRLLHRLKAGNINMDYLTGKVRDMNEAHRKNKGKVDSDALFLLWKGDEEDELAVRKGPQHIAAPKQPPPGHAESYNPAEEYLPTEEELKEWQEMDTKDRPHGLLVPHKFPNLRSVGAYEYSVRERFERCLDLYLCPRQLKRRLNIDPESLVPSLPKASDLRPFPNAQCIRYDTPCDGDVVPVIRCLSVSPDGQFLASGASDGYVRLWEVQTARLLRSLNISKLAEFDNAVSDGNNIESEYDKTKNKPVVAIEWNPSCSYHCLIAAVGNCVIVIATSTGGVDDAELTEALLSLAASHKEGADVANVKAANVVKWIPLKSKISKRKDDGPISAFGGDFGPIVALRTSKEVTSIRWHRKGDYFVTVSPKAGAAAVLIHQLSKANSQQPFSKAKGEVQCACFHPNKPFLFVASQQHIRVYHLVKQMMVKRLLSGCRWISTIDVHSSGDHLIVGSLDRRMIWFDLDLSSTPYKTLKYHEKALRCVAFHQRYPLMASSSDDGSVHIFHSMVYSDLMRNPLIVPVKILKGHSVANKLGVLCVVFHPTQPWLFSAGADGKIHLFQDI